MPRAALAALAGSLNGLVLLVPAALMGRTPWQDAVMMAAIVTLCLAVAAETWCWLPAGGEGRSAAQDDLAWLNWAQGLGLLISFELAVMGHLVPSGGWPMIGLGLILVGAVLRALAITRLGAGFTNTGRPGRDSLCVDGIYGWMRHPAEIGLILIYVGFPLSLQAWPIMAVAVPVLLVLSVLRIRAEDRGLAAAFPEAYADYRGRFRF